MNTFRTESPDPQQEAPAADEFGPLIPPEWLRLPWYVRISLGVLGVVFVVLGLLGWLMPVIPGFFLVPVGVVLIAASSKGCARLLNRLDKRLSPRMRGFLHHPVYWVEGRLPDRWQRKMLRRARRRARAAQSAE